MNIQQRISIFRLVIIPYYLLLVYCVTTSYYPLWAIIVGAASFITFLAGVGYYGIHDKQYKQMVINYMVVIGFTLLFLWLNFVWLPTADTKVVNTENYHIGSSLLDISLCFYAIALVAVLAWVLYLRKKNGAYSFTQQQTNKIKLIRMLLLGISLILTVLSSIFLFNS